MAHGNLKSFGQCKQVLQVCCSVTRCKWACKECEEVLSVDVLFVEYAINEIHASKSKCFSSRFATKKIAISMHVIHAVCASTNNSCRCGVEKHVASKHVIYASKNKCCRRAVEKHVARKHAIPRRCLATCLVLTSGSTLQTCSSQFQWIFLILQIEQSLPFSFCPEPDFPKMLWVDLKTMSCDATTSYSRIDTVNFFWNQPC